MNDLLRHLRRGAVWCLLGALCELAAPVCCAQTPDAALPERPPKLLVLTTGRVVEGNIVQSGTGYMVEVGGGQLLVPYSQIKLTADSRHEAYLKYRELMPEETAANHVALAKWCLQYQMLNDCRVELADALRLEPSRRDAREMLTYVDRLQRPQAATEDREPAPPARDDDGFLRADEDSVYGLSKETVREFATGVQPILMNNCAKAGCHHAQAENRMPLHYVSSRRRNVAGADANLQTVLTLINANRPDESPLLERVRDDHGFPGRSLVRGPNGRKILDRLERWARQAGSELRDGDASVAETRRTTPSVVPAGGFPAEDRPAISQYSRDVLRQASEISDDELLRDVLQTTRPDRFDPRSFNDRYRNTNPR